MYSWVHTGSRKIERQEGIRDRGYSHWNGGKKREKGLLGDVGRGCNWVSLCRGIIREFFHEKGKKGKTCIKDQGLRKFLEKLTIRPERLSTTLESGRERVQFTWWLIGDRV